MTLTNKDMSLWLLWPPRSSVISTGFTSSWETHRSEMVQAKGFTAACAICVHSHVFLFKIPAETKNILITEKDVCE